MSRIMVVCVPLAEKWQEKIRAAAERHGFIYMYFQDPSQAAEAARDAEILFTASVKLSRAADRLRWLCTPAAGIDAFTAPDAFASKEAVLTNSSGAYGVTIAEHTVMVTLEMLRRQAAYTAITARREWQRNLPIRSIKNSRVLMLGTGDIGRETARRFRAFGPESITGYNRSGSNPEGLFDRVITGDELDGALPDSDIVLLSLPGTAQSRHILDGRRLELLPEGALLVNVGRGSAIDEQALIGHLRSGRLTAALDVFEEEPLPKDHPLWDCPNLLVTPHVAGNMTLPYTVERIVTMFLDDLELYCAGQPLTHTADRSRGY